MFISLQRAYHLNVHFVYQCIVCIREQSVRAVVLNVAGAPPWWVANPLRGGRDVTDVEKKKLPPTCHWLVKAPSVAKCKGLDCPKQNKYGFAPEPQIKAEFYHLNAMCP